MSLVKLAGIMNWINPLDFANAAASQSGNAVKYLMKKVKGGVPFVGRQAKQKYLLSGAAQTFAKMRDEGRVVSSGGTLSSYLDGKAFSPIAFIADDINAKMNQGGWRGNLAKKVSKHYIDETGRINRPAIEATLKASKKINDIAGYVADSNVNLYGAGIGAAAGIAHGYDNEDNKALKHGLIGAAIGGGIGYGIKGYSNKVKNGLTAQGAKAHDIYFADNYWANQIDGANEGAPRLVGKTFANLFTTNQKEAARRIAKSEARQELLLHQFGNGSLKDKTKDYLKTWKMFQPSVGV